MTWKFLIAAGAALCLIGCTGKENFVLLSSTPDGAVGALQVSTDRGAAILSQEGSAIFIDDRDSVPSPPAPISQEEAELIFQDALRVHPLMPESFLLYFEFNTNELTEESKNRVGDILAAIKKRDSHDISVIGHTDRAGSDEYNRKLSLERARFVADILRLEKVSEEEITIIYHGEGNPLVPTADNIAEPRNRRVEVMVR